MMVKEFTQLRRERITFALTLAVPVLQLLLFGYAINGDARQLPAVVVAAEHGPLVRSTLAAAANTGYVRFVGQATGDEAERMLARGEVQLIVMVPAGFSRQVLRGERPAIAAIVDATDPAATGGLLSALARLPEVALRHDLRPNDAMPVAGATPFSLIVHRRYNPEGRASHNVVPGLMGVILTMTLVMMTSMAMTREHERGTLENLLATPTRPVEILLGKTVPYLLIGSIQVGIVFTAARWVFDVPMRGSLLALAAAVLLFMGATLAVGFLFSTLARSQLQSMQLTMFYFLPNLLLSGFMFPFHGMPAWAQAIGEVLPLTHFLRMARAIMLKGLPASDLAVEAWPVLVFALVAGALAIHRFRRTLD